MDKGYGPPTSNFGGPSGDGLSQRQKEGIPMRMKTMISTVTLLGGLFAATFALAGKPLIIKSEVDFDFSVIECDGFEVWTAGKEIDTEKYWFNSDGDAVRLQLFISIKESEYYNYDHPEISISQGQKGAGENITIDIDLTTGDQRLSGNGFRLTIPGIGRVIWLDVGHCSYEASTDTWKCGNPPFLFLEGDTGPALCEALAYPQ
jgi:hypothetical protein